MRNKQKLNLTARRGEGFGVFAYVLFALAALAAFLLSTCLGSVPVPLSDSISAMLGGLRHAIFPKFDAPTGLAATIVNTVRVPRALSAGLSGAVLALAGCAMQGLLKNPLADGSTLGVSSGASLGAVVAIVIGFTIPGIPFAGTTILSAGGAFLALLIIMTLAYKLDGSLSTNTIILVGVIFSMFMNSVISILVTFSGEHTRGIMFWTMGSMSGKRYSDVLLLLVSLLIFGGILLAHGRELNAFAVGEDNARSVGVNVRRVKLTVLICVSALVGVAVSVGGTIAFVGLVTPHMTRMVVGPNHRKLMPASCVAGAAFLMLSDLASRTVLSPRELPIGVVTSLVGAVLFVYIFYKSRKGSR
ncbi:MAG: iron ABC transporter permease [Oscillospiraceae bacterium]|nr:iron ABC transporter permease [Oscillospiraceae bacterium]